MHRVKVKQLLPHSWTQSSGAQNYTGDQLLPRISSHIHQGRLLCCAELGRAHRAQQAPGRASSSALEHCSPPVPNHKYLSSYKRGERDTAAQKTDKPFVVWGFSNPQKNNLAPPLDQHIKPSHQTKHECKVAYRWRWQFGPTFPPGLTILKYICLAKKVLIRLL